MSDTRLLEIVTKAVVGRAERRITWSHTVPAEGVTGVLGVHVTDSSVAVKEKDGRAVVDVLVDLDLWCGNPKQTKVIRCTARSTEVLDIPTSGRVLGEADLTAKLASTARATGVSVGEQGIAIALEADVFTQKSALTRAWVKAYDLEHDVLKDLDEGDDDSSSSDSGE